MYASSSFSVVHVSNRLVVTYLFLVGGIGIVKFI